MATLLSGHNLTKAYGLQVVLNGLTFVVSEGARIGLIGRNGAGKTTLLRIMSLKAEPDSGEMTHMPIARMGVIDQHEQLPADITALEYLENASQKPEWECKKLASRFGLTADHLKLPGTAHSGGYQMRLKIVRMLLADPNILLLDEPVNYLDLSTLLLFENFLRNYKGAFVITSHDREVLMNLCDTTWEVSRGKLTTFAGNVETYLDWKEEQAEYARRTNKRLRQEIANAQEFADRFRYKASLATRAQSKLKHIAKLRTKLKSIETDLPTAAFTIKCTPPTDGVAVHTKNLSIGYSGAAVAININLEILRGSKVALLGENGRGKSTLLKTLAGVIPPVSGEVKWWHRADVGYFSQLSEETLKPNLTVLQTLTQAAPALASGERILATAGAFLFREDDLEKPCSVLSGGERARLALATLILQEHNVLLLDEPTNHLDAETVEVLSQALKEYPGTVIVVSHARTFINGFAERIYEVRGGTVRHFLGNYEEYVNDLANQMDHVGELPPEAIDTADTAAAERREKALRAREAHRQRNKIMEKLTILDKERGKILAFFFENPTDYSPEKSSRLAELDEEIAVLEKQWMNLGE
jgi:ATP-binding cassette subfamily F protein 3